MIEFPISGVETYWWLPVLVAFGISCLTSTGGLSGAFLLLPFQVSILGFVGPAVTPTNLIFNMIATPSGVYGYSRERRMVRPLAWTIIIGTLPGVFLGAIIRINYLPDPKSFKVFVGLVLLYVGIRLLIDFIRKDKIAGMNEKKGSQFQVVPLCFSMKRIGYQFDGQSYYASTWGLLVLSLIVGIVSGIYGIGGGAIIAPFLVAVFRLPVYSIAGATLLGSFMTSIAGVIFYAAIAPFYSDTGLAITPDWMLGGLFGIGGAAGMYVGARLQRFIPAKAIKAILAICLFVVVIKYLFYR